jgi:hypothetical protein
MLDPNVIEYPAERILERRLRNHEIAVWTAVKLFGAFSVLG